MVIRRIVLGVVSLLLAIPIASIAQDERSPKTPMTPAVGPSPEAVSSVREAFSGESFPWYDASNDDFRAVMPPRPPEAPANRSGGAPLFNLGALSLQELGRLIIFILLAAVLTGLIVFVARTWQRRRREEDETAGPTRPTRVIGSEARIEALPTGLEVDESDPLEAARVLRDRGDWSRAVVLLFAHQLLALDRLGRIRLAPGRTGRQLVRSIDDDEVRRSVSRTLRLFEDVYYGHRDPDPDAFDALWSEAEALETRLSPRGST